MRVVPNSDRSYGSRRSAGCQNRRWSITGPLGSTQHRASDGPLVEKDQATAKPNAHRMECDCKGASGMMVTLPCVVVSCSGLRSPSDLAMPCMASQGLRVVVMRFALIEYARTRNYRTMARVMRGSLPLRTCVSKQVSQRHEVAEARADRATCGFMIKVAGKTAFC